MEGECCWSSCFSVFPHRREKSVSERDNLLSEGDIEACNVLPAFEASLEAGASEAEIESRVGWSAETLRSPNAYVSGESTYRHMEMMHGRHDYPRFLLAAVEKHTLSSLGVVGLACKTSSTVGVALECHQRFQHLTNRTARYTTSLSGGELSIVEERFGVATLGSTLVSDYTILVAVQLLRLAGKDVPRVVRATSRRSSIPEDELVALSSFLGAPFELSSQRATLVLDASILNSSIASADAELADFFDHLLCGLSPLRANESELIRDTRLAIRESLLFGTPNLSQISRHLRVGPRTLQRRLAAEGVSFARLLDDTRRTLAETYLADHELTLSEVAYLLGFVEQASFYRAFRRWFGQTPSAFRKASSTS